MTATDELRRLLDERGVEYRIAFDGATEWDALTGDYSSAVDVGDGKIVFTGCITPEQAIAATLGGKPDEIELTQTYDAGFRNGVMAVFQQLEGIEDYEGLQGLIAEYWGEGEGNDER